MASDAASSGAAAVTFVAAVAMLLGVMVLKLQRWLPLPYTALLLIWGIALGVGNVTFTGGWRVYGAGVTSWQNVAPAFILSVLLPGILFAGTFAMPKAVLQRSFAHIFLLGVVGVLMGTCLTAVFARYAFPFHWTWPQCLLFSSVLAATDPVAIVAVLKERQVPDELTVVVDGEALVDDGVAAVLYNVCRSLVRGGGMNAAAVVRLLCRQSLGGPAIGLAFGLCLTAALLLTPLELLPQLGLTLVAAFGSFIVAEAMLHTNGILAVVACGFLVAMLSRPVDGTGKQLHLTWTSIEWVLNTLLFILIGIIVAGRTYEAHHVMGAVRITASDYGWAVLLWVALLAIRAVDVLLLWPLLAAAGHGFMLQDALVTVWSGLRGVVGMALALLVFMDAELADEAYRIRVLFFMGTSVCLTVLVQGSLITPLLQALRMVKQPAVCDEAIVLQHSSSMARSVELPQQGPVAAAPPGGNNVIDLVRMPAGSQ